ncbi:glycine receptor subunit alpha-2 [Ixodes scapularis]|uniref:glycine receptor subunit alpha-2 n=1 Tax=Ixodes scapularis TaxID=6945 RepID=UPI001C389C7F|nr:glycine receptor subunit alpha-2 [Ixodes scapularis]
MAACLAVPCHPRLMGIVWLLWLVSAPAALAQRKYGTVGDLDKLDKLLSKYDRRAMPTGHLGGATNVSCEIYIRSFGSINPATMDYEVDLYLRQRWHDDRFEQSGITGPLDLNDPKLVQRIWKPEVFFANAKHAEFQYVTVPNVLVRISPSGDILYMLRLKLTFSCMMDLYRYPLDAQVCTIELASFSKTKDELQLHWSGIAPVILYENMKLPQFEIENVTTSLCNETFHIGEYSCLKAEFFLQRSIGYHLVQSYLPTILIVVISWVSFWLDVEAIPARITLGVTTLLTISSKGAGIQGNLPPVSYVKAIDVWMGACTMFVFAALLEFTFVNYLWRKLPSCAVTPPPVSDRKISVLMPGKTCNGSMVQCSPTPADVDVPAQTSPGSAGAKNHHKIQAKRIDQMCRIAFPMAFVAFSIVYWPYYLL